VTSPELREEAVRHVAEAAGRLGAVVHGVLPSPLPGPSGNHEYFLWLRPGGGAGLDDAQGTEHGDALRTVVHLAVREDRAGLVPWVRGGVGSGPDEGSRP
jgi:23S rRNA (cytidine1920-2'-O)/16S rRNA (cytidine1409-2'-O)-methyltransferase